MPTLVVKTIKNERMLPYTSSTYLASHSIQNIEDLLGCDLIHSDSTLINWSNWLSWHKVRAGIKTLFLILTVPI
ncbi:LysR family transcriptional regulator [Salmonella enterica subsp. enterica]|uniref:LysR family transcriptional regulator n=1 Tax=Salmonella enterica I TaxID=59201 RepID=A0A379WWS1_SALET|nr:LysR family transcriptional regulator [Salmonella enterica subsp. enterica]